MVLLTDLDQLVSSQDFATSLLIVVVDHNLEVRRPDARLVNVSVVGSLLLRRPGVEVVASAFGLRLSMRVIFRGIVLRKNGVFG